MIKVVHVITRLDFGGAQQNTIYTASHLDPARFDVLLLCGAGGELAAKASQASSEGPNHFRIQVIDPLVHPVSPISDLRALRQLASLLRKEQPAVVHTHSSKAGILGRLAARLAGVPVAIHTYHGFGFHDRQAPWTRWFYASLEWLCCRLSNESIFVSEENRRYAAAQGLIPPGGGVLIRSGIKLADYPAPIESREKKRGQLGMRMHKPLVLSIGNLKPQKNPEGFLRAAALCLKEVPDASFAFIGDGELKTRLQSKVLSLGLTNKVFFLGWRRDAAELLAAADVFVLTSLWEGLPRSLVEAMKTGLPAVCYATDGVTDVLKDGVNGFVVEQNDEPALARRVVELLRDPEKARRLGAEAARTIGPEFDIDGMVRAQEALYLKLLDVKLLENA